MMSADLTAGLLAALEEAAPLTVRFAAAGRDLYLVGGSVRDELVSRQGDDVDYDMTTNARPPEIKSLLSDIADAVWVQGERFGTIGAKIGDRQYEITTHRAEVYASASRKPTVAFGDDIIKDLARRDFTINAMAVNLHTQELLDPFGGRADLASGQLRTPLDPHISFSDDPLRMLRAARFLAAFGFTPVEALTEAVVHLRERMKIVSAERIREEMTRLLLLPDPSAGLAFIFSTGLITHVLPELVGDDPVSEGEAIRALVRSAPGRFGERWAALLMGCTPNDQRCVVRRLKLSGKQAAEVAWLGTAAQWRSPGAIPISPAELRRAAAATPVGHPLETLLAFVATLRAADRVVENADLASARAVLATLRQCEEDLDQPVPVLDGTAIKGLLDVAPGPVVGKAMEFLMEERFERGPVTVDEAAERVRSWYDRTS